MEERDNFPLFERGRTDALSSEIGSETVTTKKWEL